MQHLDEGTIHSWLDGALSADEAARVEAHVAECSQCQTAVAEARGFIAASSRILTALDHVPRGVVPVAPARKRIDPIVWRIAATLLVVVGVTVVLGRNGGSNKATSAATSADSGIEFTQMRRAGPDTGTPPASGVVSQVAPAQTPGIGNARKVAATPSNPLARSSAETRRRNIEADANAIENRIAQAPTAETRESVRQDQAAPAVGRGAGAATPTAPRPTPYFAPKRAAAVGAMDGASEPTSLRVVGTPRVIGEKRTLYELAPGDTVLLAEAQSIRLESVTVSGSAKGSQPTEKTTSLGATTSMPTSAAPPPPPDSRRAAAISSNAAASATESVVTDYAANGVTTITWIDPTTGNAMKLSGRHSREELLEIKRRIERVKAAEAAGATKK